MAAKLDSVGRILIPEALHDALGLRAGYGTPLILSIAMDSTVHIPWLAAAEHHCALATRDAPAKATHDVLGVRVVVVE
jgi:hypothetical protein